MEHNCAFVSREQRRLMHVYRHRGNSAARWWKSDEEGEERVALSCHPGMAGGHIRDPVFLNVWVCDRPSIRLRREGRRGFGYLGRTVWIRSQLQILLNQDAR